MGIAAIWGPDRRSILKVRRLGATAGPVNGSVASGPRRRPRGASRPAKTVRLVTEALPIAGVYMAGSYCDAYATRQQRFGRKPAGLRVQVSLDKPQLLEAAEPKIGIHLFGRDH